MMHIGELAADDLFVWMRLVACWSKVLQKEKMARKNAVS